MSRPGNPSAEAIATIGQVVTDLANVAERLPVPAGQAAETARTLDHLAGEITEAAAMLRAAAGLAQPGGPGPGRPGVAQPGGGWISGPSRS